MKVNKIATQPEFQPVTLRITIESQDELEAVQAFCGRNSTIVGAATDKGIIRSNQYIYVDNMLSSLYEELRG